MKFEYIEGATPIDPDEAAGLIPKHLLTQDQLNEWEQANITKGEIWLFRQKLSLEEFATIQFVKKSHKKMFDNTWRWAGMFRTTDKNIGICRSKISVELQKLCGDLLYQIKNETYSKEEIAIRFHHRLVSIHCFSNGNGRHARIITDYLLSLMGCEKFKWGKRDLIKINESRKKYIKALQEADKGNYDSLLIFARDEESVHT